MRSQQDSSIRDAKRTSFFALCIYGMLILCLIALHAFRGYQPYLPIFILILTLIFLFLLIRRARANKVMSKTSPPFRHIDELRQAILNSASQEMGTLAMTVLGTSEITKMMVPADSPFSQQIDTIRIAARRIGELGRQLQTLAHAQPSNLEPIDLNRLLTDMEFLARASTPMNVDLRFDLATNLLPVQGDYLQIRQVIINLIHNAVQVCGESSARVVVRTCVVAYDQNALQRCVMSQGVEEGLFACIELSDTGPGISDETARVLLSSELPVTDNPVVLSLAAVRIIVMAHGGVLELDSVAGQGARIRIGLPVVEIEENDNGESGLKNSHKGETVMIVDDEETVRTVARKSLERFGYQVIVERNGQGAVNQVEKNPDAIDCIILDLTMPTMDGETAYRIIRKKHPKIPIIISTGFSESEVDKRFANEKIDGLLLKPYQLYVLTKTVESVINKRCKASTDRDDA